MTHRINDGELGQGGWSRSTGLSLPKRALCHLSYTLKLQTMVGVLGLEPRISCSQGKRVKPFPKTPKLIFFGPAEELAEAARFELACPFGAPDLQSGGPPIARRLLFATTTQTRLFALRRVGGRRRNRTPILTELLFSKQVADHPPAPSMEEGGGIEPPSSRSAGTQDRWQTIPPAPSLKWSERRDSNSLRTVLQTVASTASASPTLSKT